MLIHNYQNIKRHISVVMSHHTTVRLLTITTEKAAKHIVASIIRKWPHRETFSASSSCCMNLWITGTVA